MIWGLDSWWSPLLPGLDKARQIVRGEGRNVQIGAVNQPLKWVYYCSNLLLTMILGVCFSSSSRNHPTLFISKALVVTDQQYCSHDAMFIFGCIFPPREGCWSSRMFFARHHDQVTRHVGRPPFSQDLPTFLEGRGMRMGRLPMSWLFSTGYSMNYKKT